MVLDTSALVAMLLGEPECDRFIAALAEAEDPLISAGTLLEASIVLQCKLGDDGPTALDELLAAAGVRCIAVDLAQAHCARDAFARWGKGRDATGLNFGDCFAYALAKVAQEPLLLNGDDFRRTDVVAATV
jgi:ribonuclease VapC